MLYEILISYFLGSINFAYWIGRFYKVDISKFGDGNLGATNLYYALRNKTKYAFLLFLIAGFLDLIKAIIAVILFGPLYASFVVVGHNFSIISYLYTRKIPSGVGFASTIGWGLVSDYRIILIGLLLLPFLFYFWKTFEFERGHILSLFLYPFVGWIYTLLYATNIEIMYGFLIITVVCFLARILRIKVTIEKCLK